MADLSIGHTTDGVVIVISAATFPQYQFFENFPAKNGNGFGVYSNGTVSIMAINLPNYQSFNNVVALVSESNAGSATLQFGLYSLNVSTLSLANSASAGITMGNALSWHSMITSAAMNISNGPWYLAFNVLSGGASSLSLWANSSLSLANAFPALVFGRMTVSTNAMPASIATSDLNITDQGAVRTPYIMLSA